MPLALVRLAAGGWGAAYLGELRGADNARARRALGWQPRHRSWRAGLVDELPRPRAFRVLATGASTVPPLVTYATTVLACPDHATLRHAGSAALRSSRTSMSGDCHGLLGEAGHGRIDGSGLPSVP